MTRDESGKRGGSDGSKTMVARRSPARLSRDIQAKLGDELRQMYNAVVSEGVPDRFANLLAKIDRPDKDRASG
jgi:hypothetical protein